MKRLFSLPIFFLIFVSFFSCRTMQETKDFKSRIPGDWVMDRNASMELFFKRNGTSKEMIENQRPLMEKGFLLEFSVRFQESGKWSGVYRDIQRETKSTGSYSVEPIDSKRFKIELREPASQGKTYRDLVIVEFLDNDKMLFFLDPTSSRTVPLLMKRR